MFRNREKIQVRCHKTLSPAKMVKIFFILQRSSLADPKGNISINIWKFRRIVNCSRDILSTPASNESEALNSRVYPSLFFNMSSLNCSFSERRKNHFCCTNTEHLLHLPTLLSLVSILNFRTCPSSRIQKQNESTVPSSPSLQTS